MTGAGDDVVLLFWRTENDLNFFALAGQHKHAGNAVGADFILKLNGKVGPLLTEGLLRSGLMLYLRQTIMADAQAKQTQAQSALNDLPDHVIPLQNVGACPQARLGWFYRNHRYRVKTAPARHYATREPKNT